MFTLIVVVLHEFYEKKSSLDWIHFFSLAANAFIASRDRKSVV